MTYKVGDLVYFDGYGEKGVGKIVAISDDSHLVHSTQITGGHDGNEIVEKQDNENNWFFLGEDLKPFTHKVGQKYKVISDDSYEFEIGDIVTLSAIYDCAVSRYKKDDVGYYMYDLDHPKCEGEFYADVEDAEEHKENEMFTKEDLKVGYLVKVRDGRFAHVVNTQEKGLCLNYENGWDTLRNYSNDLTARSSDILDITKVYGFKIEGYNAHVFNFSGRELLWIREEVKEMTIEDIQKALGHKIKVVE